MRFLAYTLFAALVYCGGGGGGSTTGPPPPPPPPPPAAEGTIRVAVSTIGFRLDADGYRIVLDGSESRDAGIEGSVVFLKVGVGRHTIAITGTAANCDAQDAVVQKDVVVQSGATSDVAFVVRCGTVIFVDEAHNNFHTISGRYRTFAEFLRANQYVVKPARWSFRAESLALADVLVIANALAAQNVDNWVLPTPSAFTDEEIQAVLAWLEGGGRLFLIADHMPFPGGAEALAQVFGVRFRNGFAWDTLRLALPQDCLAPHEIQVFRRSDGSLADHPITNGRTAAERVDSVGTFTGQAFEPDAVTEALFTFGPHTVQYYPHEAWNFSPDTPREGVEGWQQAAVRSLGRGRVAFFGDGTMFFNKVCPGGQPNGMNHPVASQNGRLLLNTILWLLGELGM